MCVFLTFCFCCFFFHLTEDPDAPNVLKMTVTRIRKKYVEAPKSRSASPKLSGTPSPKTPIVDDPVLSVTEEHHTKKRFPKYFLVINCRDFLDVQSWTTRFKEMTEAAPKTPAPLCVWDPKNRAAGLRHLPSHATGLLRTQTKITIAPMVCFFFIVALDLFFVSTCFCVVFFHHISLDRTKHS